MTAVLGFEPLDPSPVIDAEVCRLVGLPGHESYGAQAPGDDHRDRIWCWDDFKSEVERAIADANKRGAGDWRHGSKLLTLVNYPTVSSSDSAAFRAIDKIVAYAAKVSVHNRAVGPWACHVLWHLGKSDERAFFEYGRTRAEAICAVVLSMRDVLAQKPLVDCAGGEAFDGDPSRVLGGQVSP